MSSAVVLSAVRTAVATARKGALANMAPSELALPILKAAVARAAISPGSVDDVIFAESMHGGGDIARYAAIEAGMKRTAGVAINRYCAGSLTAVGMAAASIASGMEDVVVGGGIEAISTAPHMHYRIPGTDKIIEGWWPPTHPDSKEAPNRDMSITVGWNTAKAANLSRKEMDAWALRSHQRAIAAIDAGHFADEIVPVQARRPDGSFVEFKVDEHPRRDTSLERLGSLKLLHPEIEGFSITAGNAAGVNDGASALTLASENFARSERLTPLAKIRAWTAIGIDPHDTGLGSIEVINKLMARAAVSLSDIRLWEINEAFACVPLAACKRLNLDDEIVNISGSGCSIGHPVAASGGRMLTTLIHALRRRGGGLGVAAMCAGGGQAGAVLLEV